MLKINVSSTKDLEKNILEISKKAYKHFKGNPDYPADFKKKLAYLIEDNETGCMYQLGDFFTEETYQLWKIFIFDYPHIDIFLLAQNFQHDREFEVRNERAVELFSPKMLQVRIVEEAIYDKIPRTEDHHRLFVKLAEFRFEETLAAE